MHEFLHKEEICTEFLIRNSLANLGIQSQHEITNVITQIYISFLQDTHIQGNRV